MKPAPCRPTGFTLIELSIVLLIVSLLVGGMLVSFAAQRDVAASNETQKRLAEIRETLLGYAAINKRLPCPMPASITAPSDAGYGSAAASCTAGTEGILPWKTLGVPEVDAWGAPRTASAQSFDGYWRYRVDAAFAAIAPAVSLSTPADALSVVTNTGNTLTNATEAPVAIVFSGGPDLAASGENGTADAVYQAGERTPSFDDQLLWIGRPLLFNRMIAAGILP